MKLSELKPCAVCKGKIAPIWYVVRCTPAMLNPQATRDVLGLMMRFGDSAAGLAVAEVMAPEPDCVLIMGDKEPALMTEIHICRQCFLEKPLEMAMLMESAREQEADVTGIEKEDCCAAS
jgi:hypothetical protein